MKNMLRQLLSYTLVVSQVQAQGWAAKMDGSKLDESSAVATDSQDNVYIVGFFNSATLTFYNPAGSAAGSVPSSAGSGNDGFLVKYAFNGSFLWVARQGGSGTEQGVGVAVDSQDCVYTSGLYSTNPLILYDASGKSAQTIPNGGVYGIYVAKYSSSGKFLWSARQDGTGDDQNCGVSVNNKGNVVVAGHYTSASLIIYDYLDNNVWQLSSSGTDRASYLVQYNSNGSFSWATRQDGSALDYGQAIFTDKVSGSAYISGFTQSPVLVIYDLYDRSVASVPSTGISGCFLVKYLSNGSFAWVTYQDGSGYDVGQAVTTDFLGFAYLVGWFSSSPLTVYDNFGRSVSSLPLVGSYGAFLIKYSSNGTFVWAISDGGTGDDEFYGITTDLYGNVIVSGYFTSNPLVIYDYKRIIVGSLVNSGGNGGQVIKYSSNGSFIWATRQDGLQNDMAYVVATDSAGNVFVSGPFSSSPLGIYDASGQSVFPLTEAGTEGSYVVKYNCDGSLLQTPLCRIPTVVGTATISTSSSLPTVSKPSVSLSSTSSSPGTTSNVVSGTSSSAASTSFSITTSTTTKSTSAVLTTTVSSSNTALSLTTALSYSSSLNQVASSTAAVVTSTTVSLPLYTSNAASSTGSQKSTTAITAASVSSNYLGVFSSGTTASPSFIAETSTKSTVTFSITVLTKTGLTMTPVITSTTSPFFTMTSSFSVTMQTSSGIAQSSSEDVLPTETIKFWVSSSFDLQKSGTARPLLFPSFDLTLYNQLAKGSSSIGSLIETSQQASGFSFVSIILAGAALVVSFCLLVLCLCCRKRMINVKTETAEPNESSYSTETLTQTYTQTAIVTNHVLSVPKFLLLQFGLHFRQGTQIARGGGGVIYLCQVLDPNSVPGYEGSTMVVKNLGNSVHNLHEIQRLSFYQEIAILYLFRDNAHFAKLYGFSEDPASIVLKFYELGSLKAYILAENRNALRFVYSKRQVLQIALQLSQVLSYMHTKSFAHCDVKPDNVLLEANIKSMLEPRITDFGISRLLDASLSQVESFKLSVIKGASIAYAAPDVIMRFRQGFNESNPDIWKAGDIYVLAAVILETITRKSIWSGR